MKRRTKEEERLFQEFQRFVAWREREGTEPRDEDEPRASGAVRAYTDRELLALGIGTLVAARSGKGAATTWAKCKIVDVGTLQLSGERFYKLERLDEGGKALGFKPADELFPLDIFER